MQRFQNVVLIGTSHIAKQSFYGLMNKEKNKLQLRHILRIGVKGFVFAKIGSYIEKKLGGKVGVNPGDEMMKAAEIATKNGCKIALIDQKIDVTLKNFSRELTWKEKFRFLSDLIKGIFKKEERMMIDLSKVPEKNFIKEVLTKVKDRYPNFYKVLVSDRNKFMAVRLVKLMQDHSKIVAVVGAGHEDGLIEEIKLLIGK